MRDKEVKINVQRNKDAEYSDPEQSAEAKAVAADTGRSRRGSGKAGRRPGRLRQTLLRRQADFDNYRKRIEKERVEDSNAPRRA